MVPGVSRAATTIIGGMAVGLNRRTPLNFPFFLAVPTVLGASAKKMMDAYKTIQHHDVAILLLGSFVAFVVAMFAIKAFIGFLKSTIGFQMVRVLSYCSKRGISHYCISDENTNVKNKVDELIGMITKILNLVLVNIRTNQYFRTTFNKTSGLAI